MIARGERIFSEVSGIKKVEKVGDTVIVSDDELISAQNWTWGSFLANRENKARLVLYLCQKLESSNDRLQDSKTLFLMKET